MTTAQQSATAHPAFLDALAVYLKPRVLIVFFLGFSSGLPYALTGSTLSVWMTESGIDVKTIGLFAAIGTPYVFKFLWAPVLDALDVPILSARLGRRRSWLMLTQVWLVAAIIVLAFLDPASSPWWVALGALLVTTASATQDIVVDAFRIDSLPEQEQAAGMGAYVAAYRVGVLGSTAGALFLVTGFEHLGFVKSSAWTAGYLAMAALMVVGIITTLAATEPGKSASAEVDHAAHRRDNPLERVVRTAVAALVDFMTNHMALVALVFVILFKLTDALSGALTAPFVIKIGFSRDEYAAIIKFIGFFATLFGGFAGGYLIRACSLASSLWIGAILQALANLAFSWQAVVGHDTRTLIVAISLENFTSAVGTVAFCAYLSALCRNPLHTATQYALLTALAAFSRTFFASGAGYIADWTGWVLFFQVCTLAAVPSLLILVWLQQNGHFAALERPARAG